MRRTVTFISRALRGELEGHAEVILAVIVTVLAIIGNLFWILSLIAWAVK